MGNKTPIIRKRTTLTTNEKQLVGMSREKDALRSMASALVARATMAAQLGTSYGGDRDLYTVLGYPKTLTFDHYWARYTRQDIAKRVVDAPVNACWRKKPRVTENLQEKNTTFEEAWLKLEKELRIYHYLARVDKLSCVGEYAVLFLGLNDRNNAKPELPAEKASKLMYLRVYKEDNADIKEWEEDPNNPRYGLPKIYQLETSDSSRTGSTTLRVHHSRLLHITEGRLEDEVYGEPRLKCVYNRLQDLELIAGGSSEMFWRGAFPGIAAVLDKDASADPQTLAAMGDELDDYVHGLKRYMRLQGMKLENLSAQVADPSNHKEVLLELIAGAADIPKRILVGSERGELASTQDETNWNNRVHERRQDYVDPWVLRSFIDRTIELGVLKPPGAGGEYYVEWPAVYMPTDDEKAAVAAKKMEAIAKYASTPGIELVLPRSIFLRKIMEFEQEEVEEIDKLIEQAIAEEEARIAEEEEARAEEEEAARAAGTPPGQQPPEEELGAQA
jgi:phage-related protein (TIGR01555 family)